MPQQMSFRDGQYTKMFLEHSAPPAARTGGSSSKSLFGSMNRPPRCLRLTRGGGHTPTLSWGQDGRSLTVFLTCNTGECPDSEDAHSAGEESTLSQILEMNAPEKYYLSAKACEGILRRAQKRGKALPEMLRIALEQQIERMSA